MMMESLGRWTSLDKSSGWLAGVLRLGDALFAGGQIFGRWRLVPKRHQLGAKPAVWHEVFYNYISDINMQLPTLVYFRGWRGNSSVGIFRERLVQVFLSQ